ncbi:MAG TPA: outer membrane protein assembly factor BamD [Polyangiaceae bacterium]|nr:outer membrane protein assembly factor BamD [Polyangiaceae bacterium]
MRITVASTSKRRSKTGGPRRGLPSSALGAILGAALLGPALVGCEQEYRPVSAFDYSEKAKKDYEAAMDDFDSKNWEAARQKLSEVKRNYGYSRYARLAELRLADADYEQDKFAEATAGYKAFVHDYPNDPEIPYARYKVTMTQYDAVSASFLLPPLEERDLAYVNDAHASIRAFLNDYPNSEHAPQLAYMQSVVTGLLARHELYVARFYLGRDKFPAAIARIQYSLRSYPNSGLEPEGLVMLAEVYLKTKEREKARVVLELVLSRFPTSPFVVPAKNYLDRLAALPKQG